LISIFKLNFQIFFEHKVTIDQIERMIPWERNLFVEMMRKHIEELNEKNNGT